MKVIKPLTLGLLHKPFASKGTNQLCVVALGFFHLSKPQSRFLIESESLPKVLPQLPTGQPLDMVMPKGQSEFLVCGHAHAADKKTVDQMDVGVELGKLAKCVRVYGDREWYYGALSAFKVSAPKHFSNMPLNYDRAFGGADYPFNTLGKGYYNNAFAFLYGQRNAPMPNLEYPQQPILGHKHNYAPASFGPMDIMWKQRSQWVGTYDQKWMETRFPHLPDDADMRLHNAAAEDQRQAEPWQGGEAYRLHGMHPEHRDICGNLPEFRVRSVLQMEADKQIQYRSLELSADTVWFFPDLDLGVMLYRAVAPIANPDALDVKALLLAYENIGDSPRAEQHYIEQIELRTDRSSVAAQALNEAALIPVQPAAVHEARAKRIEAKQAVRQAQANLLIAELEKDLDVPEPPAGPTPEPARKAPRVELPEDLKFEMPEALTKPLSLEDIADGGVDLTDALAQVDQQKAALEARRDQEIAKGSEQLDRLLDELADDQNGDDGSEKDQTKKSDDKKTKWSDETWEQVIKRVSHLPKDLYPETGTYAEDVERLIEILESDLATKASPQDSESEDEVNKKQTPDLSSFEPLKRQAKRSKTRLDDARKRLSAPLAIMLGNWLAYQIAREENSEFSSTIAGRDFTDICAPRIDLSGLDLREVNFEGADLSAANFQNSNLFGVNFLGAKLIGADFTGANLEQANLSCSDSESACFEQAKMNRALLVKANLDKAAFAEANLTKAIFNRASLNGSDFSKANLTQTLMGEIQADYSVWTGAQMTQTVLPRAQLRGADFSETNMEKVIFADVKADRSIWRQARAVRCFFGGGAQFRKSRWDSVQFKTCGFRAADMSEIKGANATFYQCDFGDAKLIRSELSSTVLCRTIFSGADISYAKLTQADMLQTICRGTDFSESDLSGVNLVQADLSQAIKFNTRLKDVIENRDMGAAA